MLSMLNGAGKCQTRGARARQAIVSAPFQRWNAALMEPRRPRMLAPCRQPLPCLRTKTALTEDCESESD